MPTEYRKTKHTLPPEVADTFARLNIDERNAYAIMLREEGWTLQSISEASKITRERVRQIVNADEYMEIQGVPLPSPPVKEKKAAREYIEPDPVKLARMLELKPLAQKVRANSPKYREEAEEYSKLIAETHLEDGVTLYRLAKRLKVSHGALRFRLGRYGYKEPATGTSKVYTPIKAENRFPASLDNENESLIQ